MSNSAFRDGRYEIELGGAKRHMCFTLNAMTDVEERLGGMDKLQEALSGPQKLANTRWLITLLINEGLTEGETELTERQVGRMINAANLHDVIGAILGCMRRANTGDEPGEGEDEPSGEA